MRLVIIIILIDLFIFSTSLIFVDNEQQVLAHKNPEYHMDKYGYNWKVQE